MMNLQIGSRGSDVAQLQKRLNQQGYALAVDGAFGSDTAAAVRDYQAKNGLSVDGIVGPQTRSALADVASYGASGGALTGAAGTAYGVSAGDTGSATGLASYGTGVTAQAAPYESPYAAKLSALYDSIAARPAFAYDPEGDALYRRYRDSYTAAGRQAMDDTAGRMAALTGGYGSSYAQGQAQAAYRGYLQKLWDLLPTLQEKAYARYKAEGDDLRSQFKLLSDADKAAYDRYQGYLKQWNADRTYQLKAEQQSEKAAYDAARLAQSAAKSAKSAARSSSKSTAKSASKTAAKTASQKVRRSLVDEKRLAK